MREIISLHVGQAGINIGNASWQLYCLEHGISPDGSILKHDKTDPLESFFGETENGMKIPRCLMIDHEPTICDALRNGAFKDFYPARQMITGKEDASSNFARGYLTLGDSLIEGVMDRLRIMTDDAESLQGFLIYHSIGGGTGAGFTTRLLERLDEEYKKSSKVEFALYPSPKIGSAVIEPYNAVLTTHGTLDLVDCTFMIDNEAIYDICRTKLCLETPLHSFGHLNNVIAQIVSSVTTCLRFNGSMNMDLRDFRANLVPFSRIHFLLASLAPIMPKHAPYKIRPMSEISLDLFEPVNQTLKCNTYEGVYLACCLLYRGNVIPKEVKECVAHLKAESQVRFVDWCPTGFRIGVNSVPRASLPKDEMDSTETSLCLLSNNTAVTTAWKDLNHKFDLMFSKKAFVHWFTREGMDEDDMITARKDLATLIEDYNEVLNDC